MLRTHLAPKLLWWALLGPASLLQHACGHAYPVDPAAPSSADADEGAALTVTRALDDDPPLPGSPARGWVGLSEVDATRGGHAHAHGTSHGPQTDGDRHDH